MRLLLQRIARGHGRGRARSASWNSGCRSAASARCCEPMSEVMAERASLAERMDVAELAFCFGFPYADFRRLRRGDRRLRRHAGEGRRGGRCVRRACRRARERRSCRTCCRRPRRWRRRSGSAARAREADCDRRHAGQSRRRRPWRHHRAARRTGAAEGEGRGAVPDQRRGERRRMRSRRARAARWRCRSAASRTGCRSRASARVLKLTDGRFTLTGPMGAGQSRQPRSVRADRHRRRAGDGGVAQDAGARPGDPAPCRRGAEPSARSWC